MVEARLSETSEELAEAKAWEELAEELAADSTLRTEDRLAERVRDALEANGPGVIKDSVEENASEKLLADATP